MKANIITFHSVCNYGTQLQVFATQEKFKEYFDEVEFLDYRRNDTYGKGLIRTFSHGNLLKALIVFPTIIFWKNRFGGFIKEHIQLSEDKYFCDEDFSSFKVNADVYFTGSDQIWNSVWNNGILKPYYLAFVPDYVPKFAYASSFGFDNIPENLRGILKKYFARFNAISVREESAVSLLKNQLDYSGALCLLDPTLAMPPKFWRQFEGKSKIKGDYILVYNLKNNRSFDDYAEKLSKVTGLKLYRLCTRVDQIRKNGKHIIIPPIFDFITLIDHAKYVLTDSFHATAFSMNLSTEPICILPDRFTNRITDFLSMIGENDRLVTDYSDFSVLDRYTDFERVQSIFEKKRKEIDKFLSNAVNIIEEGMKNE